MSEKTKQWRGKTGGTQGMQRTLIRWFRHIDTRWIIGLTAPWVFFSILFMPTACRAAWRYQRQRLHKKGLSACFGVWRQFFAMSHVVLDRFAAFAGQPFTIRRDDPTDLMNRLQHQPDGFVILSSHVGNQELAGYFTASLKPMQVLIYLGDTETMNHERALLFEKNNLHFLPIRTDGSHIFDMHQALQRGEVLSIHGDRVFADSRTLQAPLLGADATFPEGPFRVAAVERLPVLTMFMLRTAHNTYELRIRGLSRPDDSALSNRALAEQLLERYAAEIENALRDYPEQWFNFYDVWQ